MVEVHVSMRYIAWQNKWPRAQYRNHLIVLVVFVDHFLKNLVAWVIYMLDCNAAPVTKMVKKRDKQTSSRQNHIICTWRTGTNNRNYFISYETDNCTKQLLTFGFVKGSAFVSKWLDNMTDFISFLSQCNHLKHT